MHGYCIYLAYAKHTRQKQGKIQVPGSKKAARNHKITYCKTLGKKAEDFGIA